MKNILLPEPHKILDIRKMTDLEWLFRVEYKDASKIQFGQFMQISLPKVGECPISITNFSVEENWIEFLIRKVGIVTDELFKLKPGTIMPMRGPYGKGFDLENYRGKNVIVVTGGSGLAPIRSFIDYIYKNPETVKSLELLFGFKDMDSVLFKEDLLKWRDKFNLTLTVDKGCGIDGECVGLVTEYVPQLQLLHKNISDLEIIIVGPPAMMKYTALEFKRIGISDENIWLSFERKMSCAIGKCGHCRIDETYVCLEGPVFNYSKAKDLVD
ncbi:MULTISPECIES: anaerobic sulfite reductase subunit AsrB [Fusobacterium]|jgi:anaerobic sulfite reductase subunit B|uniref:Anaerobic sulfite reductase subunit AsrB n=1 Tax=Fusobacterium varium ATCC 27725 TaxID=469618 RepID=A0ABN5JHL5_FUSVA|nr:MULTISPECIES: anaerobic sulfite reductase subunit AsrB [Fusobacterium]AVQ31633.1 anaerobic sulfite reductase subunit AsrB [Fusobacterium varium ATCC 27725]EES62973.1 sulfite reductase, subunit B [Fusobacterium varium ATCC 27725]MCF0171440.1 anaerobic sulfite reductase subunit AsrB [Fusobacterium varium]MCF2674095.1 anaerobic sulfite reductase subunit AsrB [Fusobacterium varium]MDY4005916.1 anaerobic sulfite reductase subunit AsrB [Fusobacterium varium]